MVRLFSKDWYNRYKSKKEKRHTIKNVRFVKSPKKKKIELNWSDFGIPSVTTGILNIA